MQMKRCISKKPRCIRLINAKVLLENIYKAYQEAVLTYIRACQEVISIIIHLSLLRGDIKKHTQPTKRQCSYIHTSLPSGDIKKYLRPTKRQCSYIHWEPTKRQYLKSYTRAYQELSTPHDCSTTHHGDARAPSHLISVSL